MVLKALLKSRKKEESVSVGTVRASETASSTDRFSRYANCGGSSRSLVVDLRNLWTSHSNTFITTDVSATGL